jgi:HlyD family secretion protein
MKKIIITAIISAVLTSCRTADNAFDASGVFEFEEITVSAEQQGRILNFDIQEGDRIEAGKTLGVIDTVQLYYQKLQLLKNAKSLDLQRPDVLKQAAALKSQIAQAEKDCARFKNLVDAGAANTKDLDDAKSRLANLNAQLEALNSTLAKSNESLRMQASGIEVQVLMIDDKLAKCRIYAPQDGEILAKYSKAGEYVAPGKPLFKIADTENVYLRAYMTNAQVSNLKTGGIVKVYADKGDDDYREYQGVITWISPTAEFTPKTVQTKDERQNLVYAVKILVHNDGFIKRGMYGEVSF